MNRDLLRNGDVLSAAVLAALGVYIFMEAREWTYLGDDGPGPGFFPIWYGIAMVYRICAFLPAIGLLTVLLPDRPGAHER